MNFLESFISSQNPPDAAASAVRDYFGWQTQNRAGDFIPSADDDVDIRTFLLDLLTSGTELAALEEYVSALKRFYQWAQTNELMINNPFDVYNFTQPFRVSDQIKPRKQVVPKTPNNRELRRLRALSQIVEQLNSSVNIKTALDSILRTLLKIMNLQTGWVSMLTDSHLSVLPMEDPPSHGFALVAAHGLPPGLEQDDCRSLRKPPACHCQHLLKVGRLTRPVNIVECTRLRDSEQAGGNNQDLVFHASVPLISQGKPIGVINVATKEWRLLNNADLHFLSMIGTQIVVALERAHFYEVAEARRIRAENELNVAREVQAGLMLRQIPDIPGFSIAGSWHPAREVGGDFYDIFFLNDGCWGIVIGDVADKGTAAALYMAMVHSLIRSATLRHHNPAVVLKEVNQTIISQTSSGMFVTAFLAVLDSNKHTLQYANAGHNPPLVQRVSGVIERLANTGSALGVFDELQMSETTITLEPGDEVVMYTDGVTEAYNPQLKVEYKIDRLSAALSAAPHKADELLSFVEADLNDFTEGAPLQDDVTLLVIVKE
jgi:serine phosphatase RsbU (regulator of sigma subunit)